jgi:N-acetyl-anhydromuramyl-L-alanine amidase AmpD
MGDLDLPYLAAASYGPRFALPAHIRVIHSTEGPMSRGNARALAGPAWFGGPAGTSAHDIFDPGEGIRMVPDDRIAWHVGPGGNAFTRGSEHCGRVALTPEQWLSADGREMLDRSARYNAAAAHRDGVLPRWLTLTQLARREAGFCTHNDVRLVFGGTTHTDPGPNFPYDWYMARVRDYYDGGTMSQEDVDAVNKHMDTQLRYLYGALSGTPNSVYAGGTTAKDAADAVRADLAKLAAALGDDEAKILAAQQASEARLQAAIDAVAPGSGISPAQLSELLTHLHATTTLGAE